jgi:hypothetical protein
MTPWVRWLLALEAAAFGVAALVHAGVLLRGYEHWKAATAESVIGLVLLAGLVACLIAPRSSRAVGLAALAFALVGTLIGIFTIAIGVGPRSSFDISLHARSSCHWSPAWLSSREGPPWAEGRPCNRRRGWPDGHAAPAPDARITASPERPVDLPRMS